MKKLYILCVLFIMASPVFAYDYVKDGFKPLQPVETLDIQRRNNIKHTKQLNLISKLEKRVFGRSFNNSDIEERVSKLEEQMLGSIFEGDVNYRLQTLQRALPSYLHSKRISDAHSNYSSQYQGIPTYSTTTYNPQYHLSPMMTSSSGWRGLAGSLGNFFFGAPTGMSPQVYSPFVSDYAPDYSDGMYTNRGWRLNNMHTGSGVGIRMLP